MARLKPRLAARALILHEDRLLLVNAYPGAGPEGRIRLQELEPERVYTISGFEGETGLRRKGRELMTDGLVFKALLEEDSALLKIA